MSNAYYDDPRVARRYDAEHADEAITTQDLPFYLELARQAAEQGESVLELGCGTGRVTLPIAAAGVRIVGLDASAAMLDVARSKSADAANPRWLQGDMASFRMPKRFGLVILPFRSFHHLLRDEDQSACLERVYEHLLPRGRLALNVFNAAVALPAARGSISQNGTVSRLNRRLRQRYVTAPELHRLLQAAGFEVEATYGWFESQAFEASSSEIVCLARRST